MEGCSHTQGRSEHVRPEHLKRDIEEPFDLARLRGALKRLNLGTVKTHEDVEKVVNQLRSPLNDITCNREFFEWKSNEYRDRVKTSVLSLFEKRTLLDVVQNYVVFEKGSMITT